MRLAAAVSVAPAVTRGQNAMRAQSRDFDSNGVNIHYVFSGDGTPVILLHGFIFSIGPAWIAGGLFDALSQTNRVVALDLRGHGQSGKPHDPKRYGLEMIHDVLRLMDYLHFDKVHLVGYSLGGILACKCLEVAAQRPSRWCSAAPDGFVPATARIRVGLRSRTCSIEFVLASHSRRISGPIPTHDRRATFRRSSIATILGRWRPWRGACST
jgi:pimeloyl-ACP methyl ester carboxylesterase